MRKKRESSTSLKVLNKALMKVGKTKSRHSCENLSDIFKSEDNEL